MSWESCAICAERNLTATRPAEPHVLGFINYTHPATANFSRHSVMGNYLPNQRTVIRHGPSILAFSLAGGQAALVTFDQFPVRVFGVLVATVVLRRA
jgi:hypothetical protein